MMRVLITGANGQLGLAIQKACRIRGIAFIPTDLCPPQGVTTNTGRKTETLDITDPDAVRSGFQRHSIDLVINCAAYTDVDKAETDSERAFLVNGMGPKTLAMAANEQGIPLVHFSTDYVFDGNKDSPYQIGDRPNPISVYGKSKRFGEEMVLNHTQQLVLIRLSWLFGPSGNHFIRKVLGWSKEKDVLRIVDDQTSSPSYGQDVAMAVVDLLQHKVYGVYHMANFGSCSRYAWAKYVLESVGWKGTLVPANSQEFPHLARRPAFSVLDCSCTERVLGYRFSSWEDAVDRYLEKESEP